MNEMIFVIIIRFMAMVCSVETPLTAPGSTQNLRSIIAICLVASFVFCCLYLAEVEV